jgi:glycosyltransferase involved in cell wall biosynthesis
VVAGSVAVTRASIVLPVYNQAGHIGPLLQEYAAELTRLSFAIELLPVINGPRRDRSLEICRELEATCPSVRTLCVDEGGWGRAVRYGLSQAAGDLLCYTNSARTTSQDLLLFLFFASVHPDCVIKANRKIRESLRRRMGSLIYNLECRALFDLPYWDINGTPKVFHRDRAPLLELSRNDDLIDLEFNVICRRAGYQMIEVPIVSERHSTSSTTTGLKAAYGMYAGAWRMKRAWGARR